MFLNLAWFPLLRKTVRLESVELNEPRIALDRLADGEINLMALLPKPEPTPMTAASPLAAEQLTSPTPLVAPDARAGGTTPVALQTAGAPPSSGWGIGVDRLVLDGGHVRFRDLSLRDAEPVDVALPTIILRDLGLQPGLYGAPAHAQLDVRVDKAGDVVLVLSTYEPAIWRVSPSADTRIAGVLLVGYYASKVEGIAPGTPVVNADHEGRQGRPKPSPECTRFQSWIGSSYRGGPDALALDRQVLALTGRHLDGLRGAYRLATATVH